MHSSRYISPYLQSFRIKTTVVVAEPERDAIIAATSGHTLIGPGSNPWEIGNAFMDNVGGVGGVSDKTPIETDNCRKLSLLR